VCDSVESASNFEDEESRERGTSNVEVLPTSSSDQPWPSTSHPQVVSTVFSQSHEPLIAALDDHGTWDVCMSKHLHL